MRFLKYLIPLLLIASTASAQRAVILQLPTGQYLGVVYLADGTSVVLTDVQVLKLPNPPQPPSKVNRVTYVYEKDTMAVPRPVSFALRKLNEQDIIATALDKDIVDGTGQVPEQYIRTLKAAKDSGLPCLVVEGKDSIVKIIKNPKTEEEVLEVIK